jgi:hypothetical protein
LKEWDDYLSQSNLLLNFISLTQVSQKGRDLHNLSILTWQLLRKGSDPESGGLAVNKINYQVTSNYEKKVSKYTSK